MLLPGLTTCCGPVVVALLASIRGCCAAAGLPEVLEAAGEEKTVPGPPAAEGEAVAAEASAEEEDAEEGESSGVAAWKGGSQGRPVFTVRCECG